jgi:hypothetical protein
LWPGDCVKVVETYCDQEHQRVYGMLLGGGWISLLGASDTAPTPAPAAACQLSQLPINHPYAITGVVRSATDPTFTSLDPDRVFGTPGRSIVQVLEVGAYGREGCARIEGGGWIKLTTAHPVPLGAYTITSPGLAATSSLERGHEGGGDARVPAVGVSNDIDPLPPLPESMYTRGAIIEIIQAIWQSEQGVMHGLVSSDCTPHASGPVWIPMLELSTRGQVVTTVECVTTGAYMVHYFSVEQSSPLFQPASDHYSVGLGWDGPINSRHVVTVEGGSRCGEQLYEGTHLQIDYVHVRRSPDHPRRSVLLGVIGNSDGGTVVLATLSSLQTPATVKATPVLQGRHQVVSSAGASISNGVLLSSDETALLPHGHMVEVFLTQYIPPRVHSAGNPPVNGRVRGLVSGVGRLQLPGWVTIYMTGGGGRRFLEPVAVLEHDRRNPLPAGWKRQASAARPGTCCWLNLLTGHRVAVRPAVPAMETIDVNTRQALQHVSPVSAEAGLEQEVGGGQDAQACVICMELPRTMACVPCGHRCMCQNCSQNLIACSSQRRCPLCRMEVIMAMKIFG